MPATIIGAITQVTQLGVEVTPGTSVAANRRLTSMGFPLAPSRNVQQFRPRGWKLGSAAAQTQEWSTGAISDGSAVSYEELQYVLHSLIAKTTPVQLGTATILRSTTYKVGDTGIPATPTSHYYIATAVSGPTAASAPTFPITSGATVTDGGVTWTEAGTTPSGFYDWIYALDTFAKDDVQTYTIESGDRQSGRFYKSAYSYFTGMEVSSGRAGEVGISGSLVANARALVTPTASPTERALIPATPAHLNLYMDDLYTDFGKTQLDGNLSCNFGIADRAAQVWFHGRQYTGPAGRVETVPGVTAELVQADGTEVDALITALNAGAQKFFRYEWLGPKIGASPSVNYALTFDFAGQLGDGETLGETDNVWAATMPIQVQHASTFGKGFQIKLRNSQSAL